MSGLASRSSSLHARWMLASLVVVGAQKRLQITNGCGAEDMWIAHMAAAGVGPDPQNVRIAPGATYFFSTPDDLTGTRYWPKLGCDDHGDKCRVGESGGPGEVCDGGCAPPVDSKFEASFGTASGDWVDISLVDGFTVPFKMELLLQENKTCGAGDGDRKVSSTVDCSHLSLAGCPKDENMGAAASNVDLKVVNPNTNDTVGCYSPCSKFTFRQWDNHLADERSPWDDEVKEYCCPTPPESPAECRAGPVGSTKFVQAVHEGCPGVYGYSYDDGMGLLRCPKDTEYHVTFYCPSFEAVRPYQAPQTHPATPRPYQAELRRRRSSEATPGELRSSEPPRAHQADAQLRFLKKLEAKEKDETEGLTLKESEPVFKIFEDGAIEIINVFEGKFEQRSSPPALGVALDRRPRWLSVIGFFVPSLALASLIVLAINRRVRRLSRQGEEEYRRVPRSSSSECLDGAAELLVELAPPVASEYTSVEHLGGMALVVTEYADV